ncbi:MULTISPECIES: MFS transporter [Halorussus]|uniref:MFS transporter n=1 Tax=Halorussus TaxID=1070314 RepID=UPI000E21ABA2|nr:MULTISPECIES: MFS transporter [Halorussus]NHN59967.1 MFS transporter [Halorussus sp. JP-T4]
MSEALRDELRDRIGLRPLLFSAGLFAVLHVLFDASVAQLAVTAITGAVVGLSEAVEEAYDLQAGVRSLGLAVVTLVSGVALLAFEDGIWWLPAAFLVVGGWLLLDSVQTLRHDGLAADDDDVRDGEAVYRSYVERRVHETLTERPRTRRELFGALDADDRDIERALDALRERGVLDREGSELRVSSFEKGRLAAARERLGDGTRRLARPLALEREK